MHKHKDIYIFLIALVSVFVISIALIGSVKVLKILTLKQYSNTPSEQILPIEEEEYFDDPLITPAWKIEK
ncbi:hypothetical protein KAI52_02620 [Candidatus Parcubacteria bacterium]|nr:hypothetical protein [Candidatus Parcubacteria bacterium]